MHIAHVLESVKHCWHMLGWSNEISKRPCSNVQAWILGLRLMHHVITYPYRLPIIRTSRPMRSFIYYCVRKKL